MDTALVLSPYYPNALSVATCPNRQLKFVRFARWFDTPSKFRDLRDRMELAPFIELRQKTIDEWKAHPEFLPLVRRAMMEWETHIIPDVLGGFYCTGSKKGVTEEIEVFLHFAGMEVKSDKKK